MTFMTIALDPELPLEPLEAQIGQTIPLSLEGSSMTFDGEVVGVERKDGRPQMTVELPDSLDFLLAQRDRPSISAEPFSGDLGDQG